MLSTFPPFPRNQQVIFQHIFFSCWSDHMICFPSHLFISYCRHSCHVFKVYLAFELSLERASPKPSKLRRNVPETSTVVKINLSFSPERTQSSMTRQVSLCSVQSRNTVVSPSRPCTSFRPLAEISSAEIIFLQILHQNPFAPIKLSNSWVQHNTGSTKLVNQ